MTNPPMEAPPPPGTVPGEPHTPWSPPPSGPAALPLAGRWRRPFPGIIGALAVVSRTGPLTRNAWPGARPGPRPGHAPAASAPAFPIHIDRREPDRHGDAARTLVVDTVAMAPVTR